MIDRELVSLACRNRLLSLALATTGSTTLAATATGYSRAAGSFVTDGFVVGQEVTPAGFTQTTPAVLDAVSALTLTVRGGRDVEASGAGRTLSVGLPAFREWENVQLKPDGNRWRVKESYLPGPASQITLGSGGEIEGEPMYVVTLYGIQNTGPSALNKMADAVLALFPPRYPLSLSNGDVVRVRSDEAPYAGQITHSDIPGLAAVLVTIPLRIRSANSY